MTFKEYKEKILKQAKEKEACLDEYKRGLEVKTKRELFGVIIDNINWLLENEAITKDDLLYYPKKELQKEGIYIDYQGEVKGNVIVINSTVEAWDNSTVKAWDNSTVEAWDNSTVKAWDNSTVKAWDNSTVEAWDNSTVKAWDNSTVKAWDNSIVKAWDNSTVEAWDNSTVEAWGNSIVNSYNGKHIVDGNAVIKDIPTNKIYIKKNNLEVIYE